MMKLDLHLHSGYSDDAMGTVKEIMKELKKKGFQGMSVTDHNTVKGSLQALKEKPKDFIVVPGMEVTAREGHILVYNVFDDIPKGLSVVEIIERVEGIGGVVVVPHLFRNMSGIKYEKLKQFYQSIAALEVFNGCSLPKSNLKSAKIAHSLDLGGTGGSDSHMPSYAGYGYTTVDVSEFSSDAVLEAIRKKETWGEGVTMPLDYRRDRMVTSLTHFFKRGFKRI